MSHHRLQQVIVWLPLSTVCSTEAAVCGWSKPDAFWPRKYWNGQHEAVLGKRSNKSLSNKTLADSFYNDQLLSCFPTAKSLHRRTYLKRHTLSHIYCQIQTELNNGKNENSPDYKYRKVPSAGSKKSSVWPPLSRVYSAVIPHRWSTPDTFWARQRWKEVKIWKQYLVQSCLRCQTNYRLKND